MQGRDRRDFLRTAFGTMGFWALAGCGEGGGTSQNSPVPQAAARASATPLLSLSAQTLATIRRRPESFLSAYSSLGGSAGADAYVQSQLGASFASLTDAGCLATFATQVAFESAPLGATPLAPLSATMREILASGTLACGHYCKLAAMLSFLGHPELIPPDAAAGTPDKATVHFLVWLPHVPLHTGVHAQLIVSNVLPDAYLLLDPTYAFAARIPFVGAGPQADLTVIENAVTLLQTPLASSNVVVLDPSGPAALPQMLPVLTSGTIGPEYIYHDGLYGCEGWDIRISQVFNSMGPTFAALRPHGPDR